MARNPAGISPRGRYNIEDEFIPASQACYHCEGSGMHWGKVCGGCDGTGKDKIRKAKQRVYNTKHGLPRTYNINL